MKIELLEVQGVFSAVQALRMPFESGSKSDSYFCIDRDKCNKMCQAGDTNYCIGEKDMELIKRLISGGSEHRKAIRLIQCYFEIVAPRYLLQELDTYKVGTVCNSSSTMHLLLSRQLTQGDFENPIEPVILEYLNKTQARKDRNAKEKKYLMKTNLPESFLQKRIYMMNYEVLMNIYRQRKTHELPQWHKFCEFIEELPYMKEFLKAGGLLK